MTNADKIIFAGIASIIIMMAYFVGQNIEDIDNIKICIKTPQHCTLDTKAE